MDWVISIPLILFGLIGHFGLIVGAYNRINATGLSRVTIKRIEKSIVVIGAMLPLIMLGNEILRPDPGLSIDWRTWLPFNRWYLGLCAAFSMIAIPLWVRIRPCFTWANERFEVLESDLKRPDVNGANSPKFLAGAKFQRMGKLPRNEIAWTETNRKRLHVEKLPDALEGLTIAHLSDIHFTGQMSDAYYRRAIDWIDDQSPDIVVLSGDIVDYEHALPSIDTVLAKLQAPLGSYFVLGNHDRRLPDPLAICQRLVRSGWVDLGASSHSVEHNGSLIRLVGNERPWFERQSAAQMNSESSPNPSEWKLGVAHSPDQFAWGVEEECSLLLCGHTHGGQIRIPGLGPLIAPSWSGSQYASGVFAKKGTLMHVSRGLSGVHPYRWFCPPEVSILELRPIQVDSSGSRT